MKNITILVLTVLVVAGCGNDSHYDFSPEGSECERLARFWKNLGEDDRNLVVFFGEDSNEPLDHVSFEEFKEAIFNLTGCCYSKPHPRGSEWIKYNRLECIQDYLEKENIQRIAFYENIMDEDTSRPKDWGQPWAEVVEPERIRETVKLFCKAMEKGENRFANEGIVLGHFDRMQIMTDKHNFIIPIGCGSSQSKVIYGVGWTSPELKKKLE
ncbi:MAG: hypothetical protein KAV87_14170 [Desulfobacteraceae bacterium]|nr:hypothetical protein [Desulfobacteraceae bacterium]